MGYLVQYLELQDDVTLDVGATIGTMKVRAQSGDAILLIYSGLVSIADTSSKGKLGITETFGGDFVNCQMSTNDLSDFHSLAGGMVVITNGDFDVQLDANTIA